jgi:hypothetical protein
MTQAMMHDITPERPLVISSYSDVVAMVRIVLTDAGVIKADSQATADEDTAPWVPRRKAQAMLADKGYLVSSEAAFIAFKKEMRMAGMGIGEKKVGRERWYSRADISRLAQRK